MPFESMASVTWFKLMAEVATIVFLNFLLEFLRQFWKFKKLQRLFYKKAERLIERGDVGRYTQLLLQYSRRIGELSPQEKFSMDPRLAYKEFRREIEPMSVDIQEEEGAKLGRKDGEGRRLDFTPRKFAQVFHSKVRSFRTRKIA